MRYEALTGAWRRDVASKLGELTGTISDDLQSVTDSSEAFALTLENAEKYEIANMSQNIQEEGKKEAGEKIVSSLD